MMANAQVQPTGLPERSGGKTVGWNLLLGITALYGDAYGLKSKAHMLSDLRAHGPMLRRGQMLGVWKRPICSLTCPDEGAFVTAAHRCDEIKLYVGQVFN